MTNSQCGTEVQKKLESLDGDRWSRRRVAKDVLRAVTTVMTYDTVLCLLHDLAEEDGNEGLRIRLESAIQFAQQNNL